MIATTPAPPYYAVIFTSIRTEGDNGYADLAAKMMELAEKQPGFLGFESAKSDLSISISYWDSLEAIANWKNHAEHRPVQQLGKEKFYQSFKTRVCKVERDNSFEK